MKHDDPTISDDADLDSFCIFFLRKSLMILIWGAHPTIMWWKLMGLSFGTNDHVIEKWGPINVVWDGAHIMDQMIDVDWIIYDCIGNMLGLKTIGLAMHTFPISPILRVDMLQMLAK